MKYVFFKGKDLHYVVKLKFAQHFVRKQDLIDISKNIAIVVNPKAGRGRSLQILPVLQNLLTEKGIAHTSFTERWPEDFEAFGEVYIVGGDGTLNYFINRYPFIDKPLGIFKGGTGNDFAEKLYGQLTVEQYFNACMEGRLLFIDAGICNQRRFINGIGIGFDGAVVKYMQNRKERLGTNLTYMYAVLRNILFYKERRIQVLTGTQSVSSRFFMITIANGSRFGGRFVVAPDSLMDDGLLNIITIGRIHPLGRLIYLPKLKKGTHLRLPFVSQYLSSKIEIRTSMPVPAHCDGELIESNVFEICLSENKFLFRC